jgi:hypothetical protein
MKTSEAENAIIVILSFPDTIVRPAYWEVSSQICPKIGIGNKHAIQAGHSALLLIKKNDPEIKYFDFGRYMTSYGNGRVRSLETDPEIYIPLEASFKNNTLTNLEDILLWLEKHPKKTHGEGRLIASVNYHINYNNAIKFINNLIDKKEFPYGAFNKNRSNCARFVTDTIINSCTKKSIKLKLKSSYFLTPSPIGNTLKGKTDEIVYHVNNQKIIEYKNRSILKEYNATFFKKLNSKLNLVGNELPDINTFNLLNATWLTGIGSGAWFKVEEKTAPLKYKISRYTTSGEKDFEGVFINNDTTFNLKQHHTFIHPTNCKEMYIKQNNQHFIFEQIKP